MCVRIVGTVRQLNRHDDRLRGYSEIKWLRRWFCRFCGVGDTPPPRFPGWRPCGRTIGRCRTVLPTHGSRNNDFLTAFPFVSPVAVPFRIWIIVIRACRRPVFGRRPPPPPPPRRSSHVLVRLPPMRIAHGTYASAPPEPFNGRTGKKKKKLIVTARDGRRAAADIIILLLMLLCQRLGFNCCYWFSFVEDRNGKPPFKRTPVYINITLVCAAYVYADKKIVGPTTITFDKYAHSAFL